MRPHPRSKKKSSRKTAARPAAPVEVTVTGLGGRGDGVADLNGKPLFVPFALPGERVRARPIGPRGDGIAADLDQVLEPAAERVTPPCPHFGTCGGCQLQHLDRAAETAWKRRQVIEALARRGFDAVPVAPTVSIPAGTRRRATFGWRRTAGGLILGFNERQSHRLVDIGPCPVLHPDLEALLPRLRAALAPVLPQGAAGDLLVCLCDQGVDARLDLPEHPDLAGREALAAVAEALDLARLSLRIDGLVEPLAVRSPPTITFGGRAVALPSGAFLQPSQEGEQAILALVEQGLEGVEGPVADLFCGLGTFSLPLNGRHTVTAIDGDPALIGPLNALPGLRAEVRDLFRDPLAGKDLAPFAAVVFDPPRAGAKDQAEALAAAGPERVVGISCNPATFARDARILVDGGYEITAVTPVDQFAWSPHLEVVAAFRRTLPKRSAKR